MSSKLIMVILLEKLKLSLKIEPKVAPTPVSFFLAGLLMREDPKKCVYVFDSCDFVFDSILDHFS